MLSPLQRSSKRRNSGRRLTREYVIRLMLVLSVLLTSLMFYVWSRYNSTQLGYELSNTARKERELFEEQQALNLELNNLTSLERVERIARKDMALQEPRADQVVYLTSPETQAGQSP